MTKSTVLHTVGRLPFTLVLIGSLLVIGALSGTMFRPITALPELFPRVAYGLPALEAGQIWTLITSIFFTWRPWMLATIALSIVLFVAPLEGVAGTRRAAIAFLSTHLLGYFLASIVVSWPLARLGVGWGQSLAAARDVGASAGAFGCGAVLTWYLPHRLVRAGQIALMAYLGFWLAFTHRVWDVEHAFAALVGLAIGSMWVAKRGPRIRLLRRAHWSDRTIRRLMGILSAVVGLANIASALLTGHGRMVSAWAQRLPGGTVPGSRSFVTLAGFLLILLARRLAQGRRMAWLAAIVLLEASAIAHILKGLDLEEAAIASLAAVILATQVNAFRVRPDVPTLAHGGRLIGLLLAGMSLYATAGFVVMRDDFSPAVGFPEAIEEFIARLVFLSSDKFQGRTEEARWFLDSLSIVWVGLVIYAAIVLLRPRLRPHEIAEDDVARARLILGEFGRTSTSPMTLWAGNTVFLDVGRRAYLSYRLIGDVALVLGDPIGPDDSLAGLVNEFLNHCTVAGWTPCFYAVTPQALERLTPRGFAAIQVGVDALVPLTSLQFTGKQWQDVRTAINRAKRESLRFEWFDQSTGDRTLRDQLWEISDAWLADKGLPELGFTLGRLTDPPDPTIRTAIAIDATGQIQAFVTWLPVYAARGWVLDLMRRRPLAMRGVMEFLIAESALRLRDEGYEMVSLATAPLAQVEQAGEEISVLQRGLNLLAHRLDTFYHFAPLFEFKRKFAPAWLPVYLVYPGASSLPNITQAILRAYLPGLGIPELTAQLGVAIASLRPRFQGAPDEARSAVHEEQDADIGTPTR